MAGNNEVGSGVGIKLTTVQPGTEGAAPGKASVAACLGAVVGPAVVLVALGVLFISAVVVPAWLVDLQAASTRARNSNSKNSLRGISVSFQEISPILPVKPGS